MLGAHWLEQWFNDTTLVFISLGVIIICITVAILLSMQKNKRKLEAVKP
jgi:type II secretory pathway component PulF